MEVTYRVQESFRLPNLLMPQEQETHLGKYAELRRQYLMQHRRVLYTNLKTSGQLAAHLAEIEETGDAGRGADGEGRGRDGGTESRRSPALDSAEYAHLKRLSADTGLKMEPVIRSLIMGTELRRRPPDELTELLRQMSGMAANINQIAKVANASGFVRIEDIEHIKTMQQMLWQAVKYL